jgi:hypothetical protein
MGSEESVEQSRGPMDKHRITRPTRPDEEQLIAKSTVIKMSVVWGGIGWLGAAPR